MASRYVCNTVLAVLIIAIFPSYCYGSNRLKINVWFDSKGETSLAANHSSFLGSDVGAMLAELNTGHIIRHLQILYDPQHKDTIDSILESWQNTSTGMIIFENDDDTSMMRQMLASVKGPTLLLLPLLSAENIMDLFQKIRQERLESHFADWLLILEDLNAVNELLTLGLEELIHEGTRVTLVARETNLGGFSLFASRVDDEGVIRFYSRGRWKSSSIQSQIINSTKRDDPTPLPTSLYEVLFPDEDHFYWDLRGRPMKIGANDIEAFFGLDWHSPEDGDAAPLRVLGIDGSIIHSLSEALNFTFRIVRPPDGLWGNPLPDGSVTGVIGITARREVSFSMGAISVTGRRETAVDFTYPYIIEPLALFSRAPKEKNRVLAILSPFTLQVWLSLLASALAISPIISLQTRLQEVLLPKEEQHPSWGLQLLAFNTFRSLVTQGNRLRAKKWPLKFIFMSWYLFSLIVSALYSGMLTAVLAIPSFETPIDSLVDLPGAAEDGFSIGITKDTANELLFREATEGIFKEVWTLFDHENPSESFVPRPEIGIRRAMERKYVFVGFKISSEILLFKLGRRKFHVGTQNIHPHGIAIACPPGVPYKNILDQMLLRMVEGGFLSKWRQDEFTKVSSLAPLDDEGSRTYSVNLTHLQAAFFLVVVGSVVSSLVLGAESIIWYFN